MTLSTQSFDNTTGTASWTNPNNALSNTADYAVSASVANNSTSTPWRGFNPFGVNPLPSAANVDGIEITVTGKSAISANPNFIVFGATLRKSGAQWSGSSTKTSASFTGTTDQTKVLGGPTDTWGLTGLTGLDFNDSTVGIYLPMRNGHSASQAFSLKYASFGVYYTESGIQYFQQFFWHEV